MSHNPDFWEVSMDTKYMENLSGERSIWWETPEDQEKRWAWHSFVKAVIDDVLKELSNLLTTRQKEVILLYYLHGKTQQEVGVILGLTQSTVSRHLHGTSRGGKIIGGAMRKLKEMVDKESYPPNVAAELKKLQKTLAA